jgi:hypothetical protein
MWQPLILDGNQPQITTPTEVCTVANPPVDIYVDAAKPQVQNDTRRSAKK